MAKSAAIAASIAARNGAAEPATSQIRIGLSCSPSCRQVMISIVSSSVPSPPGSETNASAASNIRCLRLCMESVTTRLGDALVRHFAPGEEFRDHAQHRAAGGQGGIGHDAHQPDAAAAVDETDTRLGQPVPKRLSGGAICGIVSGAGAAEHGDGVNVWHASPCGRGGVILPSVSRQGGEFYRCLGVR